MERYEKILNEIIDLSEWLENTTDWNYYVVYFKNGLICIEFELYKKKVSLLINLDDYHFNYHSNYKIKLNDVYSYIDLFLELRLYYDRVYKVSVRKWKSFR
jgi:hypothetical protein